MRCLPVLAVLSFLVLACASPAPVQRETGPDAVVTPDLPEAQDATDGGDEAASADPDVALTHDDDPLPDVPAPDAAPDAAQDAIVYLDVPQPPADAPDALDAADVAEDPGPPDVTPTDPGADPGPPARPTRAEARSVATTGTAEDAARLLALCDGPICDDTGCTILTRVHAESVTLRGDFNGWADTPMTRFASLPDAWWAEVGPVPASSDYWAYKLFVANEWRLDPTNRYIRFSDIAIDSAAYRPGVPRLAALFAVHSPQLSNDRDVYVYVPAEAFADPARRFPVLYLQDGWNVFDNPRAPFGSWHVDRTARELAAAGAIEPVLMVGVATSDRYNEYLYTDLFLTGTGTPLQVVPKLAPYAQFLVGIVKPTIDAAFPTRPGRQDTAVGGSSLGGLSAFWIAWNHAAVFGKVAALSPSFWVGEAGSGTEAHPSMRSLIRLAPPTADQRALKLYLDSGDQGYSPGGGGDPDYALDGRAYTDWMRNALIALGWPNRPEWDDDANLATAPRDFDLAATPATVPALAWSASVPAAYASWDACLRPDLSLLHLVGYGHAHNEAAWEARFPAVLRYLFPPAVQ